TLRRVLGARSGSPRRSTCTWAATCTTGSSTRRAEAHSVEAQMSTEFCSTVTMWSGDPSIGSPSRHRRRRHRPRHPELDRSQRSWRRPGRWFLTGPDRAGNLLEVIVLVTAEGAELAIHAKALRAVYRRLLER